jgi:TolA-binding protein
MIGKLNLIILLYYHAYRAYEKATAAENQLERVRSQLETAIKTEMFNHEKEMEKLRADFTAQLNAANEKIGQMGKEIAELHGKASKLQTELTTQKIVLEQECDRLVTQAREVEKSRHEQIIAELKQRLQVLLVLGY